MLTDLWLWWHKRHGTGVILHPNRSFFNGVWIEKSCYRCECGAERPAQ